MKSHDMLGCCMDMDGENIIDCMMNMLLALAYPFCCMVVLYVAVLSCNDHQFD